MLSSMRCETGRTEATAALQLPAAVQLLQQLLLLQLLLLLLLHSAAGS
jgi:hypothetical protein